MREIDIHVECTHTNDEIIEIFLELIKKRGLPGVVVECGCYKGGSAAKISLMTSLLNKELFLFDSFEGIPENQERHYSTIFNEEISGFKRGDYCGRINEVKSNIAKYGCDKSVCFVKGWFDDTLPGFNKTVLLAYLDVDLVSSTKTCLKYLYRKLVPEGVIYSQDAHLPLVCDLLGDNQFWEHEVGVNKPSINGLGQKKLVKIGKEQND